MLLGLSPVYLLYSRHRLCNRRLFRIFTVWSLFYRRVMDYSFKCTDSWSYTWLFGNQANSFVVLILVSVFSCGLLVSFVPSLSNVMAGIISLILGIVAGVICIKLQKPIIILVTAFCGALGTVQILFQLLKFEQITIFYGAFLSLAMIGSIVQFLSTRRDA